MAKLLEMSENHGSFMFHCPGCEHAHIFDTVRKIYTNGVWTFNGDREKPTFRPSLLVTSPGFVCHSFVTDGQIQFLGDCTHHLAGVTVAMVEI